MFQHVLLVIAALLFLGTIWALIKGWMGRKEGLIWAAVWLIAGIAVIWPGLTSRVAQFLGIGRGADLVFYSAVVIMLIGFWMIYIRLRRVRRDITLLVRELAILEAEKQADDNSRSAKPADSTNQDNQVDPDVGKPG